MQKVIVSGGNGFLGSSLIRHLLAQGFDVHALVHRNHDLLDELLSPDRIHYPSQQLESVVDIVVRLQPDTIFHLAAVYAEPISASCVASMVDGNVTLGSYLLFAAELCTRRPVFVNTGSYWQYDSHGEYAPNTLYAATKQAFEDVLTFYRVHEGIASLTLVLYDTFGEHDQRPKLWQRLVHAAPGTSFPLSGGDQIMHLVHVDDIVAAYVLAAEMLHAGDIQSERYMLTSSQPCTLRSLVETLNTQGELGLDLQWGVVPYWPGQIFVPATGETLPGWQPQVGVLPALLSMARHARSGAGMEMTVGSSLS